MTQETPIRPKTKALFCDECNAAARLERGSDGTIYAVCVCATPVEIDVPTDLPPRWSG